MSGCGGDGGVVNWSTPVAVDLAATRCPAIDARDRRTFSARPAPLPTSGLSVGAVKSAIDERDLVIMRMAAAGGRVIADYDKCRGAQASTVVANKR